MITEKTATLQIRTPEGIVFPLFLAGPLTRFLSWLIDVGCIAVAMSVVGMVLGAFGAIAGGIAVAIMFITFFAISIGYGIVTEWLWRGQTVGKRVLKLRVMDEHGLRLQFSQVVIRNLLRFVDMLPLFYLVGGTACLLSRRSQRLGDFVANTIVVRQPKPLEPDLDQLLAGKFNSFREHPHLEARLRQSTSAHEATVALQALVRRESLDAVARVKLYAEIAAHFRKLVEFPAEATEGISDEQYLRNVVDILFRERMREREKVEIA